jgi:hypothetical protein
LTLWIVLYFVVGAVFGLATFSKRYLFSEGSTRNTGTEPRDAMDGRVPWVLISTGLWPMLALTGVYSVWRRRRVNRT